MGRRSDCRPCLRPACFAFFLLALSSPGCALSRDRLHKSLLADRTPAAHVRDLEAHYQVRSPDVLAVQVEARPASCGARPVGLDGRITLQGDARVSVEGLTTPEIAREVARRLGVPPAAVRVQVQDYGSQFLYLFGEVGDKHHVVAYRGPETILDLLQRIGGTTEGAALGDVRVVRAHVADGKPPEVFHVDLRAILTDKDQQTNIHLEPFDRVHVGQTRSERMACCMPPWFAWLCGKKPKAPDPAIH
jgi:protein involved in polysaccharide export with SLBB domain